MLHRQGDEGPDRRQDRGHAGGEGAGNAAVAPEVLDAVAIEVVGVLQVRALALGTC